MDAICALNAGLTSAVRRDGAFSNLVKGSWLMLVAGVTMGFDQPLMADESSTAESAPPVRSEAWAVHGQVTYTVQASDRFHAPYEGPNSLSPASNEETVDATLFFGARLWRGAEFWVNSEIDQGFGLDNTLGVAGFPSGEAYKVGAYHPYFRVPRAFVRQSIDEGGDPHPAEGIANQLGGSRLANGWVFTVGKFSVVDIFDFNIYAHDPRNDFLNWAAVDAGTFDYAADAWGFTVGAAAEWYQGAWAVRAGVFDGSNVPNSAHLEPGIHELQADLELEHRHEILGSAGKVMLTAYETRARLGLLDEAVQIAQTTGNPADLAATRRLRDRFGADIDLEQELTKDLGLFARVGKSTGNVEVYDFTDIDRTVSAGLSLTGSRWSRADDTVGLAGIVNGASAARERYLNAGGLGIVVGDGRLPHPGAEQILETYYSWGLVPHAHLSLDYQFVENPAFNRDRGPVSIFAVRVHAQF
jgi:high affinity Mn2+ porin